MNRRGLIAIVILMCCANFAQAQWPVDSAKRAILSDLNKYVDAMLVIDGVVVNADEIKTALGSLTEQKVFDIIVLTKDQNRNASFTPLHDVVVVITKKAAAKHYQKTLSDLSLDYRNYLDANNNDDGNLQYILNSQPLKGGSEEQLDRLYKLTKEQITNVSLTTVKGKKTLIIDINFDE